jgi:hypothetical protein
MNPDKTILRFATRGTPAAMLTDGVDIRVA